MLYLNSLNIKNFKNVEDIDLNFSRINLISGEAGNGKTAILQAITLLLCNYTEGKLDDYLRWSSDSYDLNLDYNYMGDKYLYNINCGSSTKRSLSTPNGICVQSDAYTFMADNILDPTLTLYSNISEQGKTASLLFESPTKGLEIIKKIFKIDSLNEKVELIKDEVRENKEKISVLDAEKNMLEGRKFSFVEDVDLPDINIDELKVKFEQLQQDEKIFIEESKQYEVYKDRLKQYEDSIEKLNNLSKEKNGIVRSLTGNKRKLSSNTFDNENYLELLDSQKKMKKKIDDFGWQIAKNEQIDKDNKNIKTKIQKLNKKLSDIKVVRLGRCKYSEDDLLFVETELSDDSITLHDVKTKIKLYEDGKCPTCNTIFDNQGNALISLNEEVENVEKRIVINNEFKNKIRQHIEDFKLKTNNINSSIEQREYLEEQISELTVDLESIEDIIEVDDNEVTKISIDLVELSTMIKNQENYKEEYEEGVNEKVRLENLLNTVTEKITAYTVEKPKDFKFSVEFNQDNFYEVRDTIEDYNTILGQREHIRSLNEKTEQEKKEVEKETEEKINDISNLNKRNQILKETQKVINKDFSAYIIATRTKYLNKKMNEFFQRSYNGKYQVKFEQDKKGIGFYYSSNGSDWYPTITLSGFERQLFSLGFRLALTTLQNVKILLLDEVDSDASTQKSLTLYRNLLNEDKIDQLFIITHNEDTKEFIRNYIGCTEFYVKDGKIV